MSIYGKYGGGDKVYFTSNGNGSDGKPCILQCEDYDLHLFYDNSSTQIDQATNKSGNYYVNFRVRTGDAQCVLNCVAVSDQNAITFKITSDAEYYYAGFEEDGK